jgi:threonine dehydrogenase-like Zn-dependent dehydrogenase
VRAVRMLGREQVEVIGRPDPEPSGDRVVVQVMASALCGSERHAYFGPEPRTGNGGHEGAGVVVGTDAARHCRVGDRVLVFAASHCGRCQHCLRGRWILCRARQPAPPPAGGMHAQLALVRDDLCFGIPDDVSFEQAALLGDVLGTPFRALRRLGASALDTVLILGQGPIGLAATMLCRFMGARVIAVDINDYRLERAAAAGATRVVNPDREEVRAVALELTDGEGADLALECSATADGAAACVAAVRPAGRVAFLGLTSTLTLDVTSQLILRDLQVIGSWYSDPADLADLAAMVRRGLDLSPLVTHHYGIEDAAQAFATFFGGRSAKVILDPAS